MKDVIWPSRRKFLKRAPLVFASGLTLATMPKAAKAFGVFMGGNHSWTPPSQPALASANGFNRNTFFDDFTSMTTIDQTNTLKPGYNWYMTDFVNAGVPRTLPANSLSQSGSILTINPTGAGGWMVTRALVGTSGTTMVGQSFTGTGGYFEAKIKMDPNGKPSVGNIAYPQPNGPAFWLYDTEIQLGLINNTITGLPAGEIDIIECGVQGQTTIDVGMLKWGGSGPGPGVVSDLGATNLTLGSPDFSLYHTYGCLMKSPARNGGTGAVNFYFDGAAISGASFSIATSSTYDIFDSSALGLTMYLSTQASWPISVDYVQAWQ